MSRDNTFLSGRMLRDWSSTSRLEVVAYCGITAHLICGLNFAFTRPPPPPKPRNAINRTRFITATVATLLSIIAFVFVPRYKWYSDGLLMYTFGFILHNTNYLVLNPIYYPVAIPRTSEQDGEDEDKEQKPMTLAQRLYWSFQMLFSPRHLPGQAPALKTPPPTKLYFIARHLFLIALAYMIERQRYPIISELNLPDVTYPKEQIFRRLLPFSASSSTPLTFRDLEVRAYLIFYTYSGTWTEFTLLHSACAIVFVGLFNDPVTEWPPLFGSITEVYSLRRFWGVFWHRLMRKAFVQHSKFWLSVLRVPENSSVYLPSIVFTTFLISGLMHGLVATLSWKCAGASMGQVWYHCGLAITIILEDVFQRYYYRWRQSRASAAVGDGDEKKKKKVVVEVTWWEKVLGLLWVFAWYSWALPKTGFIAMRCF